MRGSAWRRRLASILAIKREELNVEMPSGIREGKGSVPDLLPHSSTSGTQPPSGAWRGNLVCFPSTLHLSDFIAPGGGGELVLKLH